MTPPIRTVLWFNGRGREAAEFYCGLIPNSHIDGSYASDKGGAGGDWAAANGARATSRAVALARKGRGKTMNEGKRRRIINRYSAIGL